MSNGNTLFVNSDSLVEPDSDVFLDLGAVLTAVYERGGYATLIDYSQPPPLPSLSEARTGFHARSVPPQGKAPCLPQQVPGSVRNCVPTAA